MIAYNQPRVTASKAKRKADAVAAAHRRLPPLERVVPDGCCPLSGCMKPWRIHAHPERRLHQRLIAGGATSVPDDDDEEDDECR